MNMYLGFSFIGLIVFLLPMIINIFYVIFPPQINGMDIGTQNKKFPILEMIENVTRIAYAALLCVLVSRRSLEYTSPLLYISIVFLILYYIVWIRYFMSGRNSRILGTKFLFIPMPLAVFPVLYFIFAALWMNNYIATGVMIVFGIVHNIISYQNLSIKE